MKKYVFLAFVLIFGTSMLSGSITYKKTNAKNENAIPQRIEQNVNNIIQDIHSEEQIISENGTERFFLRETKNDNIEIPLVIENRIEIEQNKTSNQQVTAQQSTINIEQETISQKNTTPTPIATPKAENTSQEVKPEHKPEVTYVTNYQMIEKIRQSIINNESEYMKQYGYTIVVDSSIKSLTNPFTYTDLRVKNLIRNSFGTIKIYAEDYCLDGEVMWTDSYIL